MTISERPTLHSSFPDDPIIAAQLEEEEWLNAEREKIRDIVPLVSLDEQMS